MTMIYIHVLEHLANIHQPNHMNRAPFVAILNKISLTFSSFKSLITTSSASNSPNSKMHNSQKKLALKFYVITQKYTPTYKILARIFSFQYFPLFIIRHLSNLVILQINGVLHVGFSIIPIEFIEVKSPQKLHIVKCRWVASFTLQNHPRGLQ
jgi:hypothetical protein